MFTPSALSIARRRRGFVFGSPPPARAATDISRITFVKTLPRLASCAFMRPSIAINRPIGKTPARKSKFPAAKYSRGRDSGLEAAVFEEVRRHPGDLPGKHQAGVAALDHGMVRQAGHAGLPDHDGTVVLAIEAGKQLAEPDGAGAGHH